ncbi:hypothetical protein [Sinomonas mesophila]|uniref:hypothetical protein n=1 Tax=Sinomonas mesophila TaxID=1531955 RepID=UPI000985F35F|nr:hypothetical protein [Sinomonas mesophila]
MGDILVYRDMSEVRPGRLEELRAAMAELAAFVELNEPRIVSYSVFFSEDGSTMSVVHIHRDVESLEYHLQVAGPKFPPIAPLIRFRSIDLFGRPGDEFVERLRAKAEALGGGTVTVHDLHAGFARLARG